MIKNRNCRLKFIFCLFFSLVPFLLNGLNVEIQAESAILINGKTGSILFEKNCHEKAYPASITKIATALLALELGSQNLDDMAFADQDVIAYISENEKKLSNYSKPAYWLEPGATHINLKKGEGLSLRSLLYGMMLVSGDDASNLIAKKLGGSVLEFMELVNGFIKKIGCNNSNFTNPHGLFHPNHYTTAYDMAILTKEALKNPLFREIVRTVRYTRPATSFQGESVWIQSNLLLRPGKYYYPYAIGVKTGYIQAAKNTLVAAAEKEDRLLIAVLLKTKERKNMFLDSIKLFEAAFNEPLLERVLFLKGNQTFSFISSKYKKSVNTYIDEDVIVKYYPSEEPAVRCKLIWNENVQPKDRGEIIGHILIEIGNGQNIEVPLKATEKASFNLWYGAILFFKEWTLAQILAVCFFVIIIAVGLAARSRR